MTLQQQAIMEVNLLSDEDLSKVIQFINFLHFSKSKEPSAIDLQTDDKIYRTRGGFEGSVVLADDFNDTPDCFKEYM